MKISDEQVEEARLCAAMRTGGADLADLPRSFVEHVCDAALREFLGVVWVEVLPDRCLRVGGVPRRFYSGDVCELFDRLFPGHGYDLAVVFEPLR